MATADMSLVTAARTGLAALADPEKAVGMRKYMKSTMPYRGVASPERTVLSRQLFRGRILSDVDTLVATALELWRGAEFREERYLAITLTGEKAYARWQDVSLLPMYEEMIVTGAWWDYVDEIAIRRVGPLLRTDPARLVPVMRSWSKDPDPWRRRTSVICQVTAKEATDTDLLAHCVEANIGDPDFFLRKGIGWALRDYSKVDPQWVRGFVESHPDLSPLSRREGTKYI
ncbi:DNA alkylation repair protein [Kibdelosporangium lantanae]|uniref:DNA alkylation repair protein n=1 Tax=Kibdelosporangium lantanae TaxID=1497396 RepID=A0ABW3MFC2_9PSEU